MKKIYATSQVKNEADIIESFIRYALVHFDGILLTDDGSTDNTQEIIHALSVEFPERVIVVPLRKKGDAECRLDYNRNKLLQLAFEEYNADIVVPLDADEFLITENAKNVRQYLEELNDNACYLCRWKTFIYSPYEGYLQDSSFVPSRYMYYRDPHVIPEMTKVVVLRKPWFEATLSLVLGNHTVKSTSNMSFSLIELQDLFIAHYPIRSIDQIKSKIIKFRLHNLSVPDMAPGQSSHNEIMYHQLKKNNLELSNDDISAFSYLYSSTPISLDNSFIQVNSININPRKFYPEINCIHKPQILDCTSTIVDTITSVMKSYDKLYPYESNKGVTLLLNMAEKIALDYRGKRRKLLSPNEQLRIKLKWILYKILHKYFYIIEKAFPLETKRGEIVRNIWYELKKV